MPGPDPGPPLECNLSRRRGDTFEVEWLLVDENDVAVPNSGFNYVLSVNPSPNPSGPTGGPADPVETYRILYTGTGDGLITFAPSAAQADTTAAGVYFYEVEQTDTASAVRTIIRGEWEITEDLAK